MSDGLEYSNGWRLSNGKRVFLPYILREKGSLKETNRFLHLESFTHYAETTLKVSASDLKLSKDTRFLFELPNHFLERI